jgi:hypothetical protein
MSIALILLFSLLGVKPCASYQERVDDTLKRPFDDRSLILIDVDGDSKPDIITPRVYSVKGGRKAPGHGSTGARESHWISFDLKTSTGRTLKSLFSYEYGTDEADYWVYALVPCEANRDGRTDLLFYSGDDTSDERVVLLNKGGRFSVHSRKVSRDEY